VTPRYGAASVVGTRPSRQSRRIRIGACLSLTGGFQTVGRQALFAGAKRLYATQRRQKLRGKKETDSARGLSVPDVARRV